ncbi:uncharacterized protein BXZ73DRAFT_75320 [Epithele typhae]|uniref:uncharacterized protein n=1 Tax=Epithele typhae TaxID=378194 RepID=UPI0020083B48|nr:uncharacterized protein BXZ73DRAFT_75320 [Epithele typhae]KAH9940776.1 hypothetical protein BXZ73DRAFT_75320 [Epithele typhae]
MENRTYTTPSPDVVERLLADDSPSPMHVEPDRILHWVSSPGGSPAHYPEPSATTASEGSPAPPSTFSGISPSATLAATPNASAGQHHGLASRFESEPEDENEAEAVLSAGSPGDPRSPSALGGTPPPPLPPLDPSLGPPFSCPAPCPRRDARGFSWCCSATPSDWYDGLSPPDFRAAPRTLGLSGGAGSDHRDPEEGGAGELEGEGQGQDEQEQEPGEEEEDR